jgi:hypothetical protein
VKLRVWLFVSPAPTPLPIACAETVYFQLFTR